MSDTKQKHVRLKEYNQIIIFPQVMEHSEFQEWNPISAGFCYINKDKIQCFGESISLSLKSKPKEDTELATKQIFGIEAMLNLLNE